MAAPTTIEVSVDRSEYSRYESGKDTITCTVVIDGGAPYAGEEIIVDLIKARRSRDAVVATTTISFTSSTAPQSAAVTFYLPDIVDQDLISLVRHGKYFVKASSVTDEDVYAESGDFDISIVTVDRLKNDYLFGLDLSATEIKEPKFQPKSITGVTVEEISRSHPKGVGELNYVYHQDPVVNATASIGSGANGAVVITANEDFAGAAGNAYSVLVSVPLGTSALSASVSGSLLTVSLDVTAGVPNPAANTASLIAAAIDSLDNFSAVASGTGSGSFSVSEGPTSFTGGVSNTVRQLNWRGGPLVSITSPGTYILLSGNGGSGAGGCAGSGGAGGFDSENPDYICVRITSVLLMPTSNVVESLIIDTKKIDDETLHKFLCQAVSWVENDYLATFVEPTNVVTDRDPTTIQYSAGINAPAPIFTDTDFDYIWSPLTYFVPRTQGQWVKIQTPFPQLLRVDNLYGAIANTRVIDIDLEWIEHSEQGGLIQLVPFNQEIAFDFIGLLWSNALRGASELPNFWHYNVIAGLREASCDIQELIAKRAAINALVIAGQALRPGLGSVSLSRDGVSESVSYINSAQYGLFTGTITAYKEWIDERGKELRAKYRGITMVVC